MTNPISSGASAQLADIRAVVDELHRVAAGLGEPAGGGAGAPQRFASAMVDALHDVDGQGRAAAQRIADVESGRSDDLVGAMLASQQASLSFSMLLQVRNKVMGAVDELTKLPL